MAPAECERSQTVSASTERARSFISAMFHRSLDR